MQLASCIVLVCTNDVYRFYVVAGLGWVHEGMCWVLTIMLVSFIVLDWYSPVLLPARSESCSSRIDPLYEHNRAIPAFEVVQRRYESSTGVSHQMFVPGCSLQFHRVQSVGVLVYML